MKRVDFKKLTCGRTTQLPTVEKDSLNKRDIDIKNEFNPETVKPNVFENKSHPVEKVHLKGSDTIAIKQEVLDIDSDMDLPLEPEVNLTIKREAIDIKPKEIKPPEPTSISKVPCDFVLGKFMKNSLLSCPLCDYTTITPSAFKRHKTVHTGAKPFSCSLCDKRFSRYDSLKKHQMRHTGKKPFKCLMCGNKFSVESDLNKHQKTHQQYIDSGEFTNTGSKPYKCSECGKRFKGPSSLSAHKKHHRNDS